LSLDKSLLGLVHPADDEPKSILVKRGPVILTKTNEERELIFLTRGFLLATVGGKAKGLLGGVKIIPRAYEQCGLWSDIISVTDAGLFADHTKENISRELLMFMITVHTHDVVQTIKFSCTSPAEHRAWVEALERVVIQAQIHKKRPPAGEEEVEDVRIIAWEHELLQTSVHTLALMGNPFMMENILKAHPEKALEKDIYRSYTPLHIATLHKKLECMKILLEYGANVHMKDEEDNTAMNYAQSMNFQEGVELLREYGAKDDRGELLEQIAATEAKMEADRARLQAIDEAKQAEMDRRKKKASALSNVMSENMDAMKERGERLEQLDDKTRQMENEASDFRDNARLLKEKMKKKANSSWFGL